MKIFYANITLPRVAFFFCALLFFCGCDKRPQEETLFQLMTSPEGKLYRLDKRNGQIMLIEGDRIKPLKLAAPEPATPPEIPAVVDNAEKTETVLPVEPAAPPKMKSWPEMQLDGKNLKVEFKTVFENNKMNYTLEAFPYSSLKRMLDKKDDDIYYQRKWHGFIINLLNQHGVTKKSIPVNLWEMSRILDENGKFASVKSGGEIIMSENEYTELIDCAIDWKIDRLLIPDYKFPHKIKDLMQTYNWYGEVDPRQDKDAPPGAKYWWMTFPNREKIYFSTEEELLNSYQKTVETLIEGHSK